MAACTVLQPRHLVSKPPELGLRFTHRHSTIMQVCSFWLVLLSRAVAVRTAITRKMCFREDMMPDSSRQMGILLGRTGVSARRLAAGNV